MTFSNPANLVRTLAMPPYLQSLMNKAESL